jgi:signal transduction histidine kinase
MPERYRNHDEVLAMLGHELRNPLAAIATAVDLIELTTEPEGVHREAIQTLRKQVPELVRLVDGLIDVSRVLMGQLRLAQEWTDLRELARQAGAAVEPLLNARMQRLVLTAPAEAATAFVDRQRLQQAVVQLLENASKFSPEGGLMRLDLASDVESATLRVRDEGIGIGPDLLPHVFEPFVQGSQALDRAKGGVGIGLTLARELARLHGGELSVVSEGERRGSEFTLRIPRGEPQG